MNFMNLFMHAFLTIITGGLWIIILAGVWGVKYIASMFAPNADSIK